MLFLAADDLAALTARLRTRGLPFSIGVAAATGGPRGLGAAYEEARQTAVVLQALGRSHDCRQVAEIGVYRSLFSQSGNDEITTFVTSTVVPLLDHDRHKHRDLATTVHTYVQQAQHHARTCELLHIHPNTLYQRLDRVSALLGQGWREPDRVLQLQLALHLRDLQARLAEEHE